MNPDYGQTFWSRGFRGEATVYFDAQTVMDYGRSREVTGVVRLGDEMADPLGLPPTMCLTVSTKQTVQQITQARDAAGMVWVKVKLSPETMTGGSGEVYRMLVGRIIRRDGSGDLQFDTP